MVEAPQKGLSAVRWEGCLGHDGVMNEMSRAEAMELLGSAPVAHIGVVFDGDPYVSPVSFVVIGDRIAFRTVPGRRLEALRSHPQVSIEVSKFDTATGEWASVVVNGQAHEIEDTPLRTEVVSRLFEKYREAIGSPMSRGGLQPLTGLPHVVVVEIDEISGRVSGSGFGHRIRPGRL